MQSSQARRSSCRSSSLTVAGIALVGGCATVQSGSVGVSLDGSNRPIAVGRSPEIQVSAGEKGDLSSPYFGLVEVTFENNSPAWKQIDHIQLDFGSPDKNQSVQIPWGEDIDLWEDAVLARNEVRAINTQEVLAAIAAVGALGLATSHRHGGPGAHVGGVITVGALSALFASRAYDADAAPAAPPAFSASHLLSMPVRIPPGLFTKRWILFYTAGRPLGGCVDRMILSYDGADGTKGRVLLPFKTLSEWQRDSCERPGRLTNTPARS
jgi:hypothetical protein